RPVHTPLGFTFVGGGGTPPKFSPPVFEIPDPGGEGVPPKKRERRRLLKTGGGSLSPPPLFCGPETRGCPPGCGPSKKEVNWLGGGTPPRGKGLFGLLTAPAFFLSGRETELLSWWSTPPNKKEGLVGVCHQSTRAPTVMGPPPKGSDRLR
ncbi:hypothetical protein SMXD51_07892, partial [Ligilactobacillus salivarius SMXD51]